MTWLALCAGSTVVVIGVGPAGSRGRVAAPLGLTPKSDISAPAVF